MTTLTFTVLKYGFVILLWLFAWLVVRSLHRDIAVFLPSSRRSRARRKRAKGAKDSVLDGDGYPVAAVHVAARAGAEALPPTTEALHRASAAAQPASGPAAAFEPADQMATAAIDTGLGTDGIGANQPTLLTIIDGPTAGTTFPLTGQPISLGRAPTNTVIIDDEFVSGSHARVFLDPISRRWMLEDLESTNGTYLDGAKIHGVVNLPARVPVRVGATSFELR